MIGIVGGSLGALGAILSIGQGNPWWSLAVFFLCIYIVHGIIVFGEEEKRRRGSRRFTSSRRASRSRRILCAASRTNLRRC